MDTILGLLGGLALFLYAMAKLSDTLKPLAGDRMKSMLAKLTTNAVAGVVTGCVATTILDSSSVTIILVIALVHAGALTFEQSMAVILGSNIGTTVSSQLFATQIDRWAPLIMIAGLVIVVLLRGKAHDQYGYAVFFLGLLLYGLHLMGLAMEPLAESASFERWLKGLESPVYGACIGALATAIIQSSSAFMGIVVKLASAGLMTLPAGIAVMLGAEIGTCLDTLVASVGRSREAIRAGMFHLIFNLTTVTLGLIFYRQLAAVAGWLPAGNVAQQIANAHVFFNVAGALLFLPFLTLCASALKTLITDGGGDGNAGGSATSLAATP
ncbi:MAG: Na/Pi symporter [Bryobacteraceae bacterium]